MVQLPCYSHFPGLFFRELQAEWVIMSLYMYYLTVLQNIVFVARLRLQSLYIIECVTEFVILYINIFILERFSLAFFQNNYSDLAFIYPGSWL